MNDRHRRIATALLADANERLPHRPNPYLVRHLSGHVAAAGMWPELAGSAVLDHLDPETLARDAFRTAFGNADLPAAIAATMSGHHVLAELPPESRATTRDLIARQFGPVQSRASDDVPWSTRWAAFRPGSFHLVLGRHGDGVTSAASLALPDGRTLLATGSTDGTLRLWDPAVAAPVGAPIPAHPGGVEVVTAVELDGRMLLASGGADGTVRVWDPVSGQAVGEALTGHDGPVRAMAAVTGDRVRLVTGGEDGTVRFWDPLGGGQVDAVAAHRGGVLAMTTVPLAGRTLLATGGADMLVRLWDPATRKPVGKPLTGHDGAVRSMTPVRASDGRPSLATSADDGTTRLWHLIARRSVTPESSVYVGTSWSIASVPMADGRTLLAAGGVGGVVTLWDVAGDWWFRTELTGHSTSVLAIVTLPATEGKALLATASNDGTVRLWNPDTARVFGDASGHPDHVRKVEVMSAAGGATLLATQNSTDGVLFWDAVTGVRQELSLPAWGTSMTTVPLLDGRTVLATGGSDGSARLWDLVDGSSLGDALGGHEYWVEVGTVETGGRVLLATTGNEGTIRLRDPVSGKQIHRLRRVPGLSTIYTIAGVPTPRRGTLVAVAGRGGVWLWNPAKRMSGLVPLTRDPTATGMIAVVPLDDAPLLATAHEGGPVRLWDPLGREPVGEPLTEHTRDVSAMSAVRHTDGRILLATGSYDQTIRLWDPLTGTSLLTMVIGDVPHDIAGVEGGLAVALDAGVAVLDVHAVPIRA